MRASRRMAAALTATAVAWSAGCTSSEGGRLAGSDPACASADYVVPSETLRDLVTYADEVAVVEVAHDRVVAYDLPNDGLEEERHREVTIEVVDVVWTAPQDRPVPRSITFLAGFAGEGGGGQGPAPCDQPVLEVGHRYLVGMVEYTAGSWAPMTGPFVLGVDASGEVDGVIEDGPLSRFHGRSAAEVGAALAEVDPDPAAAPYRERPADVRFEGASSGR